MLDECYQMKGTTIFDLADGCAMRIESIVKKFSNEFEDHIKLGCCPLGNGYMGSWG